jgi:hypothetical protein
LPRSARKAVVFFALSLLLLLSPSIIRDAQWIRSGEDCGLHAPPDPPLKSFVTRSGLLLYVPEKGDQCWDAPLPCTPYPNSDLRLRSQGDTSHGFMLEVGAGSTVGPNGK